MVDVKTSVSLNPWQVPNFATVMSKPVLKQDGFKEAPSIPVADLDASALDALAFAWLDGLYTKAKKPNPFTIVRAG